MHPRTTAIRTIALGSCLLTLAAACASSHGSSNASRTNATAPTSTTDPNLTPNSIPYVVGERIGLPHGWLVTVAKVHLPYSTSGLPRVAAGRQYIAVDIAMENQGPATHTVSADKLFTMVDASHGQHFVVADPAHANAIDGQYPPHTAHTGRLVFVVPANQDLGLVLYGPRIGTQVSFFTIVPPTVPS